MDFMQKKIIMWESSVKSNDAPTWANIFSIWYSFFWKNCMLNPQGGAPSGENPGSVPRKQNTKTVKSTKLQVSDVLSQGAEVLQVSFLNRIIWNSSGSRYWEAGDKKHEIYKAHLQRL